MQSVVLTSPQSPNTQTDLLYRATRDTLAEPNEGGQILALRGARAKLGFNRILFNAHEARLLLSEARKQ